MIQIVRGDANIANFKAALDKVMIVNICAKIIKLDRKISGLHLTCERIAKRLAESSRSINIPLTATDKQRREKWKSLNVVPVCVAEQDVPAKRTLAFG